MIAVLPATHILPRMVKTQDGSTIALTTMRPLTTPGATTGHQIGPPKTNRGADRQA